MKIGGQVYPSLNKNETKGLFRNSNILITSISLLISPFILKVSSLITLPHPLIELSRDLLTSHPISNHLPPTALDTATACFASMSIRKSNILFNRTSYLFSNMCYQTSKVPPLMPQAAQIAIDDRYTGLSGATRRTLQNRLNQRKCRKPCPRLNCGLA